MDVPSLMRRPPKLHKEKEKLVSYQILNQLSRFLDSALTPKSRTLETGAGISSIIFAIKNSRHLIVSPDKEEIMRVFDYCKKNKISTTKIKVCLGKSEIILPSLNCSQLDIILIDGNHAFPSPFIDWYYAQRHLKVGGLLIIDDTHLYTGKILRDFLMKEPEWELVNIMGPRATVFKKIKDGATDKWWGQQKYIVEKSRIFSIMNWLYSGADRLIKN